MKYSSEVSCWLSTKQLAVIIYAHKAGAPRSNTEKFTQPLSILLSTMRVALTGVWGFEVSCNLLIPLTTRFIYFSIYSRTESSATRFSIF